MTITKWMAAFAMGSLLLTTACKKDDNKPSNTQLLTERPWKLTALTSDPAIDWFGASVTNVYAQLPACVKDDISVFKTNGIVNFDEGTSKCDPNDPQTVSGLWTFNTDETILSVTQDGETESWKVLDLKSGSVKVEYAYVFEGITYTFTATYAKQ